MFISAIFKTILGLILALIDGLVIWWLNPYGLDFSGSFLTAFLAMGVVGSALILHEVADDL